MRNAVSKMNEESRALPTTDRACGLCEPETARSDRPSSRASPTATITPTTRASIAQNTIMVCLL